MNPVSEFRKKARSHPPTISVRTQRGKKEIECINLASSMGYEIASTTPVWYNKKDIIFRRTKV